MEDKLVFDIEADELELFLEEVNEHLHAMESGILGLEQGANPALLNETFRAAHTLKALTGTIKHHRMAELTHATGTLFDGMRTGQLEASGAVVDDLLSALDVLKHLREEIVTLRPSGADTSAVLKRLQAATGGGAAQPAPVPVRTHREGRGASDLSAEQQAQVNACREEGQAILEVVVTARSDAFAPAARLSQAVIAVMEASQVIAQRPTMAELAKGQHANRVWLVVATKAEPGTIHHLLADVVDLAGFAVEPCSVEMPPAPAPAPPLPAGTPAAPAAPADLGVDKTVRISVERLDTLMNLVGELVTNHTRLLQGESCAPAWKSIGSSETRKWSSSHSALSSAKYPDCWEAPSWEMAASL